VRKVTNPRERAVANPMGDQKGHSYKIIYHLKFGSNGKFTFDEEINPLVKMWRDANVKKFEVIEKAINLITK
jgi:hypothetical protein